MLHFQSQHPVPTVTQELYYKHLHLLLLKDTAVVGNGGFEEIISNIFMPVCVNAGLQAAQRPGLVGRWRSGTRVARAQSRRTWALNSSGSTTKPTADT